MADRAPTAAPTPTPPPPHSKHQDATLPWWYGWLPLIVLPWPVAIAGPLIWPRWVAMWALAGVIFCGCKWLTWRRAPVSSAPRWQQAAYLLLWPGLDPAAFLAPRPSPATRRPTPT